MRRAALLLGGLMLAAPMLSAAAPEPEKPPANEEIIYQGEATSLLGRSVRDPSDREVGRIVDALVDDQGVPRAAVIDFGGFMGVGSRKIAVAWRALHFQPAERHNQIRIDLTVDQIKATPEYKPATPSPQARPMIMAVPPPPPGMPASGK